MRGSQLEDSTFWSMVIVISVGHICKNLEQNYGLYLYRDPMRDGGKIRTPSVNSNPEYQLASRVATSQLKEPRVMPVDTRDSSWYEGLVLPLSRIRGPGIDITTFANQFCYVVKFLVKSHHIDIQNVSLRGKWKMTIKLIRESKKAHWSM